MFRNKKVVTSVLILLLVIVIGFNIVDKIQANPMNLKPYYEILSIQSPQNNCQYSNFVHLNVTLTRNAYTIARSYYYTIDSDVPQKINLEIVQQKEIKNDTNPSPPFPEWGPYYFPYSEYTLQGSVTLSNLATGGHNITVNGARSAVANFYVNNTSQPASYSDLSTSISITLICAVTIITLFALISYIKKRKFPADKERLNAQKRKTLSSTGLNP